MVSKNIFIHHHSDFKCLEISLPASKSISNRALIIDALAKGDAQISNLSHARDTQTMQRLLGSNENTLDVIDAGTTMRFLTAYLTITNQNKLLTGSERMQERPISILVKGLQAIGGKIEYVDKKGYPPIQISGINNDTAQVKIKLRGDVSSQYISAMMMIAPLLTKGLEIELAGKIGSKPYIEMTRAVMLHFGVDSEFTGNTIRISKQQYLSKEYIIEPDWSAASYWYSFVALSLQSSVLLKDLKSKSIQGDSKIVEIMSDLGVNTEFNAKGALLTKKSSSKHFTFDFTDCPDLAQTVAVICAAKGIKAEFKGLESLKIKETDRVWALQNELSKLGAQFIEESNHWSLYPTFHLPDNVLIKTYDDHRMAMAFAPLSMLIDVEIENNEVVKKSYPDFWKDLRLVGLDLHEVD